MSDASYIADDPDLNILSNRDRIRRNLEQIGYTEVQSSADSECIVFVSATGNRIIISEYSIGSETSYGSDGFRLDEPYDSDHNLGVAIELAQATRAAVGDASVFPIASDDENRDVMIYAAILAGLNLEDGIDVTDIPESIRQRMDAIWNVDQVSDHGMVLESPFVPEVAQVVVAPSPI